MARVPIVSDVSSLPEVVGDVGLQVDPRDVEALAAAMLRALGDSAWREAQERAALQRAAGFTWGQKRPRPAPCLGAGAVKRLRVLMLTPSLPWPAQQGGAMRNFGLLYGLHQAGHEVTLLSFGAAPESDSPLHELCSRIHTVPAPQRRAGARLRALLLSSAPDLAHRLHSALMTARLTELLQRTRFDVVQFEGLEICGLLPLVRRLQPEAACCYDAHNAEYRLQQNLYAIERHRASRWPAALWSWLQARAHRPLRARCLPPGRGHAGGIGRGRGGVVCAGATIARACGSERHLCQGLRNAPAAARERRPDARLHRQDGLSAQHGRHAVVLRKCAATCVAGLSRLPPEYRWASPRTRSLQSLHADLRITLTGRVDAIQPWLNDCDVYIAPLRMGSGTRFKIMEAAAGGCAIVATTLAVAGLPAGVKEALLIADRETDMAAGILTLLQDPDRRMCMGRAARSAARDTCDWAMILPHLQAAWERFGI